MIKQTLWNKMSETTPKYVMFSDYSKETEESVAVFLSENNASVLWRLMEKYHSEKSDEYQFVFSDTRTEKPEYQTDYNKQKERSLKIRREWVEGELVLPELGEDPKEKMIELLANGGIKKYMK